MGAVFDKPAFWLVLVVLLVLLFGAKRLPDLSRSVGRSLRIFKAETEGLRNDERPSNPPAAPLPPAVPADAPATASSNPPPIDPGAAAPRYLVDPVTGERVLAQPVSNPQQPQG